MPHIASPTPLPTDERSRKWRLLLGSPADPENTVPLEGDAAGMDAALEALYDSERTGNLGSSAPRVNRWLGDIRKYFPGPVVQVLQRDALERLGLKRMLLEPELLATVEPDVHLVGVLMSLSKLLPERSRETARLIVEKVVRDIEDRLRLPVEQALRAGLRRAARTRRPRPGDIDWDRTIRANLRHYQPEYKTILPVSLRGHARRRRQFREIIVLIDQSGSMAASVVYAGVMSCILASLPSVTTRVIAFDTAVVDLTDQLPDPLELLFAIQLGGGTDIGRALAYAGQRVSRPHDTILILLSDLYEGGLPERMIRICRQLVESGVKLLPLLALSDEGAPAYDHAIAAELADLGCKPFACTPGEFAGVLEELLA